MTQGLREKVRPDLEVVYYYQGEVGEPMDIDPGWYLEAAGNRRVSGPWISRSDAMKAIPGIPNSAFHTPEGQS